MVFFQKEIKSVVPFCLVYVFPLVTGQLHVGSGRGDVESVEHRQRRRHQRAPARLPIWVRSHDTGILLQGHTANVSAGGIYLLAAADSEFPVGAEVSVVFGLRDDDHDGYNLHQAEKGAEIVRLERLGYGIGIALKFVEAAAFCRCAYQPTLS